MKKKGMETETLVGILFGLLVLVVIIGGIVVLKIKGISLIELINNLF